MTMAEERETAAGAPKPHPAAGTEARQETSDAAVTGGLTGLARIARMALDCGLAFTPHTWGNGIGLLANAHLAAGAAKSAYLEYPFDPPTSTPERWDFAQLDPVAVDGAGWIDLTEAPGLGIELDEERLVATAL